MNKPKPRDVIGDIFSFPVEIIGWIVVFDYLNHKVGIIRTAIIFIAWLLLSIIIPILFDIIELVIERSKRNK